MAQVLPDQEMAMVKTVSEIVTYQPHVTERDQRQKNEELVWYSVPRVRSSVTT